MYKHNNIVLRETTDLSDISQVLSGGFTVEHQEREWTVHISAMHLLHKTMKIAENIVTFLNAAHPWACISSIMKDLTNSTNLFFLQSE